MYSKYSILTLTLFFNFLFSEDNTFGPDNFPIFGNQGENYENSERTEFIIRCTSGNWQSCIDNASCGDAIIVSNSHNYSVLEINKYVTIIADQDCSDGTVPKCDGSDECISESAIGNGSCNISALSCYQFDGGDCEEAEVVNHQVTQEEQMGQTRAAGARQKAPRGSEIDFPDVRDDCSSTVNLINLEFNSSAANGNTSLLLRTSRTNDDPADENYNPNFPTFLALDNLFIENCVFDGDNSSGASFGIRNHFTMINYGTFYAPEHHGEVKNLKISNSTISGQDAGMMYGFVGEGNNHIINSTGRVKFINNTLHLNYQAYTGNFDANFNYWDGLGPNLNVDPNTIAKLNFANDNWWYGESYYEINNYLLSGPLFQNNFGPWYLTENGGSVVQEGVIEDFQGYC
ncbi:uncharacterized protein METZ01_LOCUS194111, partial [marine metagenome]